MSKKQTYKNYTPAFKEEAVALIKKQGYSVSQAAESLGIRTNQLYQWKQKLEQSRRDSFLSPDEKMNTSQNVSGISDWSHQRLRTFYRNSPDPLSRIMG